MRSFFQAFGKGILYLWTGLRKLVSFLWWSFRNWKWLLTLILCTTAGWQLGKRFGVSAPSVQTHKATNKDVRRQIAAKLPTHPLQISAAANALADIRTIAVERRSLIKSLQISAVLEADPSHRSIVKAPCTGQVVTRQPAYQGLWWPKQRPVLTLMCPALQRAQLAWLAHHAKVEPTKPTPPSHQQAASSPVQAHKATRSASDVKRRDKLARQLRRLGMDDDAIRALKTNAQATGQLTILAPRSGTLTKLVGLQTRHRAGQVLFVQHDPTRLWARASVTPRQLHWLRLGQQARLLGPTRAQRQYLRAFCIRPGMGSQTQPQVIFGLSLKRSQRTRQPGMQVQLRVAVRVNAQGLAATDHDWSCDGKAPQGSCLPCSTPRRLPGSKATKTTKEPLLLPVSTVIRRGGQALVYALIYIRQQGKTQQAKASSDQKAQLKRPKHYRYRAKVVTLGPRIADHYVVLGGLLAGDRVVREGVFQLHSEALFHASLSD